MEQVTPEVIWAAVLSVAAAVVLLANAIEKIVKAWKAAKAPNDQQNKRLDDLETWKLEVDRKLARDNDRMSDYDASTRVTQRALLALLDHSIDGNNIEQMQHAKEELQDHLINR